MENNKKITYLFLEGRKRRLTGNFPNDFFYFYKHFVDKKTNLNLIESSSYTLSFINLRTFLYLIDKILRKITKLPFYSYKFLTYENWKILNKSDYLIFTNETIGYSMMLYAFITKVFKKNKIVVFTMGLFENEKHGVARKTVLQIYLWMYDKFIFLSKNEYDVAVKKFQKYSNKFYFLPFSIDNNFWKPLQNNKKISKKILFMGNDKNRDYKFIQELSKNMPNFKFILISNHLKESQISSNSTLYNSDWKMEQLTDEDVRNIFEEVFLCLIPLKESIQPSGQSVAMQSMNMGVPVLITRTKGFWDELNFTDKKNIFFLDQNNVNIWKEKITEIFEKQIETSLVVKNAHKTLEENYNQDILFKKFTEILN